MIFEIILIALVALILLWLTISVWMVIITLVGPPEDIHDVTINDREEVNAAKSEKLR